MNLIDISTTIASNTNDAQDLNDEQFLYLGYARQTGATKICNMQYFEKNIHNVPPDKRIVLVAPNIGGKSASPGYYKKSECTKLDKDTYIKVAKEEFSSTLDENKIISSLLSNIKSTYYNNIITYKNTTNNVTPKYYFLFGYNLQNSVIWKTFEKNNVDAISKEMQKIKKSMSDTADGFFYRVGIFNNGKLDTNTENYYVIYWSPSSGKYGDISYKGYSGDVSAWIEATLKASISTANVKSYILLKVNTSKEEGYEVVKGIFADGGQASLSEIQRYLQNNTSLDTSPIDWPSSDSSGGSGGQYYEEVKVNPITGIPQNTVAQINYINDFMNYTLTFAPGLDKRSIITDPFVERKDKVEYDSEQLILKVKISDNQLNATNSTMKLTDNFYLYKEMSIDTTIEEEDFYNQIDEILDLNLTKNSTQYWKKNIPPLQENNEYNNWTLLPMTACAMNKNDFKSLDLEKQITMEDISKFDRYTIKDFMCSDDRTNKKLLIFDVIYTNNKYQIIYNPNISFSDFLNEINYHITYLTKKSFYIKYNFMQERSKLNLYSLELFEAYTRGHDFIQEDYTTVRAKEMDANSKRYMTYKDNYFLYKYSGRDFDIMRGLSNNTFSFSDGVYAALVHECDIITETDVTLGDSFGQNKYFIEYIKYKNGNNYEYKDTFKVKDYLEAIDATIYTEDDIEIVTSKIDLTQCQYYNPLSATYENDWSDCCYGGEEYNKECMYQKLGYCPYRFDTEKHPRKIRTLSQSKSNRFNLIQELSKVFKIYPQFYIEFDENGKIKLDENGKMKKHVFFITEKGNKAGLGFRYEKNLSDISRSIDSNSLTTKLFVESVDSDLSSTGLCSIQTAEDNIAKTSYLLDFSYYTKMNLLDEDNVKRDLYGIEKGDFSFLPTIGYYNDKYDKLTDLIINLTGETMVKLEAELETYIQGVTTSLEEKQKISQKMYQFKTRMDGKSEEEYTISDTYKSYLEKMKEQSTILWGQIETLFFTGDNYNWIIKDINNNYLFISVKYNEEQSLTGYEQYYNMVMKYREKYCKGELFWRLFIEGFENEGYKPIFDSWIDFKENIIDTKLYITNGKLGQYNAMFNQVKVWKTERAKWLNKINDISKEFYQKYEPFIKEGTWTDSNYLTDNEYYWAAYNVLKDSCEPKVTYTLKVIDLSPLDDDYTFDLADTTFVEDIDFFGISPRTGLPNQEKVMVSGITYDLDMPTNNTLEVKNYSASFDELFQSITASVQSLTFNENTYKRAANFTATKYIEKEALQGTLFNGDLTLLDNYSENVVIDDTGIQGKNINNSALGYKIDGEGIAFTKDNGQSYDIGIGPSGINADYIKFGQLDASKVQIVDNNYIYFLWDKNGINAYRNPATSTNGLVDFARFNKYGLSLIENNNVRLRAGYEFKNNNGRNLSGKYDTELDLKTQNIGFYLYNDSGQAIFKTETSSDYSGVDGDYSARLSLAGEMFVTNKVLDGENDGSVISREPEYLLSGGLVIKTENVPILYEQDTWKNVLNQYTENRPFIVPNGSFSENGDKIICPVIITEEDVITPPENPSEENPENPSEENPEETTELLLDETNNNEEPPIEDGGNEESPIEDNVPPEEVTKIKILRVYIWKIKSFQTKPAPISYILDQSDNSLMKIDGSGIEFGRCGYETFILEIELENEVAPGEFIELETTKIEELLSSQSGIYSSYDLYINHNTKDYIPPENSDTPSENPEDPENPDTPVLSDIKEVYTISSKTIRICTNIDLNASTTGLSSEQQVSLNYYDVSNLEIGKKTELISDSAYELSVIANGTIFNYWRTREFTGNYIDTARSSVSTEEVGIFINNKNNISNTTGKNNAYQNTTPETELETTENDETEEITTYSFSRGIGCDINSSSFILIGDSITNQLDLKYKDLDDNIYGVGSAGFKHYSQFNITSNNDKTDVAFFMGMNGMYSDYGGDQDSYSEAYIKFIQEVIKNNPCLKPNNIYLISIISVDEKINNYLDTTNEEIKIRNTAIKYLCENKTIIINDKEIKPVFINIYDATKNIGHQDRVHPSDKGLEQLLTIIKDALGGVVPPSSGTTSISDVSTTTVDPGAEAAAKTALGGSERVFTIALRGTAENGETVYNNVLTVLKNGYLYMGGTITDFFGHDLDITNFNLLPDEIRIAEPKFILSNTGYMWMDFAKMYPIDPNGTLSYSRSLWDMLSSLGESAGSGQSGQSGLPAGYYLIDPLSD